MKRIASTFIASAISLAFAAPAFAASDYLLEIEGIKGEASSSIDIMSWSWGGSNPSSAGGGAMASHEIVSPRDTASGLATGKVASPRDVATGQSSGKRQHKPIRVGGSASGAQGGVNVAVGDLNGDGLVDFADTDNQPQVEEFTLTVDKATPKLMETCAKGTHFPKAIIKARGASFALENAIVVSCTTGQPKITENQRGTDSTMPNRISMNVTTPKQTQGATFGERRAIGVQLGEPVTMVLTGQLRHTKTGHVTLLK